MYIHATLYRHGATTEKLFIVTGDGELHRMHSGDRVHIDTTGSYLGRYDSRAFYAYISEATAACRRVVEGAPL